VNYLALGDSITVGVGAPPGQGYVEMVGQRMKQLNPQYCIHKICKKGIRSRELFLALYHYPTFRQMIRQVHLISLWIGGNDLTMAYAYYRLFGNEEIFDHTIIGYFHRLNDFLKWLHAYSSADLYLFTLYNPFPKDPLANRYIPKLNDVIIKAAHKQSAQVVNVYPDFEGREAKLISGYQSGKTEDWIPFLQKNPIHPNSLGHRIIANRFWNTLTL
jgi:lysophospholipase L1-like esterase